MRALARQDIQWRKGHTLISQLMAAGEFPARRHLRPSDRGDETAGSARRDGSNTVNPVVATLNGAGLSAKPPHPNTARLFIDFLLSKPAQQRLRALRRIPARSDVEPLSPKMDQSRLKLAIALRDSVEEYNTSIKEFRGDIWTMSQG